MLCKFITQIPDINQPDNNDNTLLHHAANNDWAATGKITELVRAGANINTQSYRGLTALHLAAETQRADAAKELINCRASVNVIDKTGKTPISLILHSYGTFFDFVLDMYERTRLLCRIADAAGDPDQATTRQPAPGQSGAISSECRP